MNNKLDRIGEINYNTFGSEMIITRYKNYNDIDVYFPKHDWTFKGATYQSFKNGNIKCPYEPRVYNRGFIGIGKYKTKENGKHTKCYTTWYSIIRRCYDSKFHERNTTYKECEACKEWLNYQNFAEWFDDNYYEIEGETMCLDKDILNKGNKIYSFENCVFAPERINTLFVKCNKTRGEYPIGVSYNKQHKKFQANYNVYDFKENKGKQIYLGYYDTQEQAFEVYKQFKEQYVKQVADEYKDQIPQKLYDAMYNYEVDIDD